MKKIWRDRWLEWLDTPGRPQARDEFYDSEQGCYCAIGGLCQLVIDRGVSDLYWADLGIPSVRRASPHDRRNWWDEVVRVTGLYNHVIDQVIELNDGARFSLPEIAAWVRDNAPEGA